MATDGPSIKTHMDHRRLQIEGGAPYFMLHRRKIRRSRIAGLLLAGRLWPSDDYEFRAQPPGREMGPRNRTAR